MQKSTNDPTPQPDSSDGDQADGKVVRLMPRLRPATERAPTPETQDDDDDPGPSAA